MNRTDDVNNKSDDEVVEVGSDKAGPWTQTSEALFVDLMDEEVRAHSRKTGSFTKPAWTRIINKLIAETSYPYNREQIKNKYNQLRTLHTKLAKLLKQTGVGWDPVLCTVTAEPETWERLMQINDKARKFRREGFPHFAALSRVLGDTTAKGRHAHLSTKSPSETGSSDPEFKVKTEDLDEEVDTLGNSMKEKKTKTEEKKGRKRDSQSASLTAALEGIADSSRRKADILEKKYLAKSTGESVTTTGKDVGASIVEFDKCIEILENMEEVDAVAYAKVVKLLHDDPTWVDPFLKMGPKRKLHWILNV